MQILFIGRLISLLTVVAIAVGVATSTVPRGSTVEPAAAELPFARSRDGVRETYIVSFGLFGPESVFASEAQKAAQILRARLQGEAQVLVRFNDKRDGNATSATLAAALRSAGQAMVPEKDILVVFLTSHGSPDGLAVVAGRRSETLSPRSFRSMLNSSGARYRVVIISACYSGASRRRSNARSALAAMAFSVSKSAASADGLPAADGGSARISEVGQAAGSASSGVRCERLTGFASSISTSTL